MIPFAKAGSAEYKRMHMPVEYMMKHKAKRIDDGWIRLVNIG
jgi:hypothetical protein